MACGGAAGACGGGLFRCLDLRNHKENRQTLRQPATPQPSASRVGHQQLVSVPFTGLIALSLRNQKR